MNESQSLNPASDAPEFADSSTLPDAVAPGSEQAAQRFNLGNQAFRGKDWTLALSRYEEALALNAKFELAQLGRARSLVRLGQTTAAREAFAAVLRLNPANYSAWLEAGHLCRQMGEFQQAAGAYQRSLDADPTRHEAPLAMARVLQQMGQAVLSERAFLQAQDSARRRGQEAMRAEVCHRMGQYRLELGDTAGAVRALAQALDAVGAQAGADRLADVQIDMAEALLRQGRLDAALPLLTAASAASGEALLARLGALAFRHNLWSEALAVLRKNVDLHPQSAGAHWALAQLLAESWQMEEAEQTLQRAEALAPMAGAPSMRASIAGRQGDVDTALAIYRELALQPGAPFTMASSAAMASLYSDQLSAQQVAALHQTLFAPLGEACRSVDSFARPPLAGRRVRLGIVSADFHHQHPVNIFMQPVLRELDRDRFEVFIYFTGVNYDDHTRLAQQRAAHWVEVSALNDAQLARRVDTDGIDLLLDLAGHTGQQRMSVFARRAAPVQASYLGYPGSTGVPNMDWLIGDQIVTPPEGDPLCSERVARLPGVVFCFAPEDDYPSPAFAPAWADRPLTFGSFNTLPKLTARTLSLWTRVLAAVPGSRLVLKTSSFSDPGAIRSLSRRLQALGVDLSRLEFRKPAGLADMMAEYADIDIALDPVPYNGGTTSLQAMWMGVPVVTQRGHSFVSRMGASFMTAAGLAPWVAEDDDAYVRIAREMSLDRPALLALKRGLRARLQSLPAWDPVAHTRALEAAFMRMLEVPAR